MIEKPDIREIDEIQSNGWMKKYILTRKRFCPKCDKETQVELDVLTTVSYWYALTCANCNGIEKHTYEKQTMPYCEECQEPYSMSDAGILIEVYDKTGARICSSCVQPFLKRLKGGL